MKISQTNWTSWIVENFEQVDVLKAEDMLNPILSYFKTVEKPCERVQAALKSHNVIWVDKHRGSPMVPSLTLITAKLARVNENYLQHIEAWHRGQFREASPTLEDLHLSWGRRRSLRSRKKSQDRLSVWWVHRPSLTAVTGMTSESFSQYPPPEAIKISEVTARAQPVCCALTV